MHLLANLLDVETSHGLQSCVIMLSTTFSFENGFFHIVKVLKHMQHIQNTGTGSAFRSSNQSGVA